MSMIDKVIEVNLTHEEAVLLEDLNKVVADIVITHEKWRVSISRHPKPRTVSGMGGLFATARQANSIGLLVESGHVDGAMILLRSLIEAYLNISYIYIADDLSNMVRFMYDADKSMLDNTKKYQQFVNTTYTKVKYTPEMFSLLIDKYNDAILDTSKMGFPLKPMPDLRSMSESLLKHTGCPFFGELYFNSYLLLCDGAHASASVIAAISMSKDFEERWGGGQDLGSKKETLTISLEVLASMVIFLEKNAKFRIFKFGYLDRQLINKYNRYEEYEKLKLMT